MEKKFQLTFDGQAVQQQDLNLIGDSSGLSDDHVFAELFRMAPFDGTNTAKGILPYGSASDYSATVSPNGASGSVLVRPFRAFVGSTTAVGTDAQKNWHDIRSGLSVAEGATTLATAVAIGANLSGHARWDLIYAAVTRDAPGDSTTRKVKDTTSLLVSAHTVATHVVTGISIQVLQGTPAASPVWPAVPADGVTYNIPIAYVRVPNTFGPSSTVATTDIAFQAPLVNIAKTTGGKSLSVATSHHTPSTSEQGSWGAGGVRHPRIWIPPDMVGSETVVAMIDMSDASGSASWSHQHLGVVDARDWRGRFCKAHVTVNGPASHGGASTYPWTNADLSATDGRDFPFAPGLTRSSSSPSGIFYGQNAWAIGQSLVPTSGGTLSYLISIDEAGNGMEYMGGLTSFALYVDHADGGKLKVAVNWSEGVNAPGLFTCWLEFTGPYTNK